MEDTKPDKQVHIPTDKETEALSYLLKKVTKGRTVIQKSYNQLNNRSIYEAVDDWTKRWNGYIPTASALLDADQSRMFLNFTRNQILSYLSNTSLSRPKTKIKAVNKKTGSTDTKFAQVLNDLVDFSANEENGDARFLEASLEAVTKGTVIVYEGYARNIQKMKVPQDFDPQTGKIRVKEEQKTTFDNCYQRIVPLEDFYIANPYQPNIQKQPFLIWREITTYDEAKLEYGDYKNFKDVKAGQYSVGNDETTFYRNSFVTELNADQVEIVRYYEKSDNRHILAINGIVIYDGPIPFKDGLYPFAKGIFEPFGNDFFWGMAFPQKIMGEQDLINTFWNMMADKTFGSLLPFGMSSDLDDWIEDDTLALNRIRKVGDINKWKWDTLPGVSSGEQAMLQTAMNFARENSGLAGGGPATTPKGGKLNVRQVLLQQQDSMRKMSFPMSFMEDLERDRITLRLHHILQFYSIPKLEKVTGKNGKEIDQLTYRDVKLSGVKLSDGKSGNKSIQLVNNPTTPDERKVLEDKLSVDEAKGEINGTPTEALAIAVDTFYDYNFSVQVLKASSFEKNAALDQAARMEFANWRIPLAQVAPLDAGKLVDWVSEAFDIDQEQFKPQQPQPGMAAQPQQGQGQLQQIQPSSMATLSNTLGA